MDCMYFDCVRTKLSPSLSPSNKPIPFVYPESLCSSAEGFRFPQISMNFYVSDSRLPFMVPLLE